MRILVDMDGVIADFEAGFLRHWRCKHPDLPYFPLGERTTFYIKEQYPPEFKQYINDIMRARDFYFCLEPVDGAIEALHEMKALGMDVVICTSPMLHNDYCIYEKYQWVRKNLGDGWDEKMVITKDKTIVRGNFLIDDMPLITGADQPVWEHILYSQSYNQGLPQRRLTWQNWKDVLL